ncbi:hypothetical protein AAEV22_003201 [Escherichia coli]
MKQVTLIEMDGFLKGKCIPRDLKVNETSAEYLVRKFGELELKLETALREFRSAGITIDNLEAKCAKMAVENAGMSARTPVAYSYRYAGCETCEGFQDWRWELSKEKPPEWMLETGKVTNLVELFELPETPATDAFLDEVRAQGVELAISQAFRDVIPANRMQFISRMTAFANQLRKGGNQ